MPSNARPRTSKPRGICKYYITPRGCFAGSSCKFLHGAAEQLDPQEPLLTPYDAAKRCKFYASGFCRYGDQCWFRHVTDDYGGSCQSTPAEDDLQSEPCSICFEKPVTYGLLSGCSHIFCISCIRQWRDQKGQQIERGNMKKCPMCREPSRFITPSSRFWKHGHPEKDRVTKAYRDSMAKVPCRYFKQCLERNNPRPLCPFGKDCFYQHLKDDGTPYVFRHGADVCMPRYYAIMRPPVRSVFDDFVDLTSEYLPLTINGEDLPDGEGIFLALDGESVDRVERSHNSAGAGRSRRNNRLREDPLIRRQLDILREAMDNLESAVSTSNDPVARTLDMVRMLVQRHTGIDPEPEVAGPLESHSDEDEAEIDHPPITTASMRTAFQTSLDVLADFDGMPNSVSESSLSEAYLSDSDDGDSDSDEISRLGRYLRSAASRRFGESSDSSEVQRDEDEEARLMQEIAERGPEEAVEAGSLLSAETDEPQMSVMDYEIPTSEDEADRGRVTNPPFLTDGRGRVVWSSDGEVAEPANSGLRQSAETLDGDELVDEMHTKNNGLSGA